MAYDIPIVFLHGFLGSCADFDPVCDLLQGFLCHKVLLPGHLNQPFSEEFSNWMPNFEKMHLVGYSLGGRIALQFAKQNEKKIQSLTLLSTHPGLQKQEEKDSRLASDRFWIEKMQNSFEDFLIQWNKQNIFGPNPPIIENQKAHNVQELAKTFSHFSLAHQERINLKKAFFAVGEFDEKYRTLFPNGYIIKNAFHRVHLENPKAVANLIKQRVLK